MKIINFLLVGVAGVFAALSALPLLGGQIAKLWPSKDDAGNVLPPVNFPPIGDLFKNPVLVKTFGALGVLVGLLIFLLKKNLGSILRVGAVGVGVFGWGELSQYLFDSANAFQAQFLFTVGAGATVTQIIQYLPQYLTFNTGAQPAPSLLQVDINGRGLITNLDQDGINNLNKLGKVGNQTGLYQIALANGTWKSQNGTITITNPGVNPIDIFGAGERDADTIVMNQINTVLANTGFEFTKFAYLLIPGMAATDKITIDYLQENGKVFTQDYNRDELLARSLNDQDEPVYLVDNFLANIKSVRFTPVADRKVYSGSYQSI